MPVPPLWVVFVLFLFVVVLGVFLGGLGREGAREVGGGGWGALLMKYSVDALISDEGISQCRSIFKIR